MMDFFPDDPNQPETKLTFSCIEQWDEYEKELKMTSKKERKYVGIE